MRHYYPKIGELREDTDTKQKEIADYLKMTQQQYSLYETGKREPPASVIANIAMYYHVSADYILGLPKGLDWPR